MSCGLTRACAKYVKSQTLLCCHYDLWWHFILHAQNSGAHVGDAGLNLAYDIS